MRKWIWSGWLAVLLLALPNLAFGQDKSARIFKFSVQATEGGHTFTMPPGRDTRRIRVKWPEGTKKVTLRVEWLAKARRLEMRTYRNNQPIKLKGDVESRQITYKDTNCDEYKGTFPIEMTGKKDFTIRIDLVKIGVWEVVQSFVIKYLVPKDMTYHLRKSIQEIFNFHRSADKAQNIFDKARSRRRSMVQDLRRKLSKREREVAKLKEANERIRKALQGEYGEEVKRLEQSVKIREDRIKKLEAKLNKKNKNIISLKGEVERLRLLLSDRNPPEVQVLNPKEKDGKKYVAHSEKLLFKGLAKDSSDIREVRVNGEKVKFKKEVFDNGKTTGARFEKEIKLKSGENQVDVTVSDAAGNKSKETFVITRKIPILKEFVCNNCRYRVSENEKFCPNCGAGLEVEVVEKRFRCQGCELSGEDHTHIRVVRRKKGEKDKAPPELTITTPSEKSFINKKFFINKEKMEFRGKAKDNIEVIKVLIQGKEVAFKNGQFKGTATLKPGENTVEITAVDSSENKKTEKIDVVFDNTSPKIEITKPNWKYVFTSSLSVQGKVEEKHLQSLQVNGQNARVNGQGEFEFTLPMSEDVKELVVVAKDMAGNATKVTREILYKKRSGGDDQFESNNVRDEAFPLRPGRYEKLICKDEDWYRIKISEPSILRVKIYFPHRKGDLELKLYSPSGAELARSTETVDNEFIDQEVKGGEVLVKVYGYQKGKKKKHTNSYDMFVKIIPIARPLPGLNYVGKNSFGLHEYTHKKTGQTLVLIPSTKFWMGSPNTEEGRSSNEGPRHSVYLDSFLIGKYEVTQKTWKKIMGDNPAFNKSSENMPVEMVSWKDVRKFCKKAGLRLPTEAQWERACRAEKATSSSKSSRYYWGNQINGKYCWYRSNAYAQTKEVGRTLPNEFGLYDMLGNVREWCYDWYGSYSSNFKRNPRGPKKGEKKVNRGGSAGDLSKNCRCATRFQSSPTRKSFMIGFRVALPIPD